MPEKPLNLVSTCVSLRHKLMYVDVRHATPGLLDTNSDTRVYWCLKTQDCRGPDGQHVGPCQCSQSRSCFSR